MEFSPHQAIVIQQHDVHLVGGQGGHNPRVIFCPALCIIIQQHCGDIRFRLKIPEPLAKLIGQYHHQVGFIGQPG